MTTSEQTRLTELVYVLNDAIVLASHDHEAIVALKSLLARAERQLIAQDKASAPSLDASELNAPP